MKDELMLGRLATETRSHREKNKKLSQHLCDSAAKMYQVNDEAPRRFVFPFILHPSDFILYINRES